MVCNNDGEEFKILGVKRQTTKEFSNKSTVILEITPLDDDYYMDD